MKKKLMKKDLKTQINYSGLSEFINKLNSGLNTNCWRRRSLSFRWANSKSYIGKTFIQWPWDIDTWWIYKFFRSESENHIRKIRIIKKRKKEKISFIISHKMKPLKLCDEIIVLESGKVLKFINSMNFMRNFIFFIIISL